MRFSLRRDDLRGFVDKFRTKQNIFLLVIKNLGYPNICYGLMLEDISLQIRKHLIKERVALSAASNVRLVYFPTNRESFKSIEFSEDIVKACGILHNFVRKWDALR